MKGGGGASIASRNASVVPNRTAARRISPRPRAATARPIREVAMPRLSPMSRRSSRLTSSGVKHSEDDDVVLSDRVAHTPVRREEIPKSSVGLVRPNRVHFWKFGENLDAIPDLLPDWCRQTAVGFGCRFGPKDLHRDLLGPRSSRTTRS